MTHADPTRRFSNRVADYLKYRPSYPPALLDHLAHVAALTPDAVIADLGSGTGLLTELFLRRGHRVFGLEPNAEMRAAGEQQLAAFPLFTSLAAPAEATTLPDHSIDLIVAGQAFHWFDRPRARAEFRRILRASPRDNVALIWNERLVGITPFLAAYEELLQKFSTDYASIDHRQITDDVLAEFFHPHPVTLATFKNRQLFDLAGVKGRLLSSSYAPAPGDPRHEPMLAALAQIFHTHQQGGRITFDYQTKVYASRL